MTSAHDPVFELLLPDGPHRFEVVSFQGHEQISAPYSFEILLVGPEIPVDVIDEMYIGAQAHFHFGGEDIDRWTHGFIRRMEIQAVSGDRDGGRHHYRIWLSPSLWLLGRGRNSRIFQDLSVPDIVRAVLGEGGVRLRFILAHEYEKRTYCVQHQESDRKFVERLLAEEGIFYFFEQPEGPNEFEIMVLADTAAACGPIAGEPRLAHKDSSGMREGGDDVRTFRLRRKIEPGSILLRDFDFTRPAFDNSQSASVDDLPDPFDLLGEQVAEGVPGPLRGAALRGIGALRDRAEGALPDESVQQFRESSRQARKAARAASRFARGAAHGIGAIGPGAGARVAESIVGFVHEPMGFPGEADVEVYDHHGEFEGTRVSRDAARTSLEQERRNAWVGTGEGRCHRLSAGYRFELHGSPHESHDRAYVVFRVEHRGRDPRYAGAIAAGQTDVYRNDFQCVPANVPFRPRKPKRRLQQVMETAIVVGPDGREVHTDEHGRIKVQFHWDRKGRRNEHSSCWMRVMQPWAGAGWGFQFIPRIGMEVMVVFLAGDTDRPMVIGSVYNSHNPPPFPLPADRTKSGIRTRSTPTGTGHNEISFQDRAGYEKLHVRAEKDLDVLVRNNETRRVESNQVVQIQGNQFAVVQGNRLDSVAGNSVAVVTGNDKRTVEQNLQVEVKGKSNLTYEGGIAARIREELDTTVDGREHREVTGTSDLRVEADHTVRVGGNHTVVVGQSGAGGSTVFHTVGTAEMSSTGGFEIQSDEGIRLRCGDSVLQIGPNSISISSPTIGLYADDARLLLREENAQIIAKTQFLAQAQTTLLRGSGAVLELTATAMLHGSQIQLVGPDNARDDIRAPAAPEITTIELKDQDGNPIPHQRFVLHIGESGSQVGVLDENGRAEVVIDQEGEVKVTFPDVSDVQAS